MDNFQVVVLFSGGLDSILTAKLLQAQNLKVLCLHATSPFFGHAEKINHWSKTYDLNIQHIDVSEEFVKMFHNPTYGFGKTLNPCIDCKIVILQAAKNIMSQVGAFALASGAVSGQRPMSQRKDALNLISKAAAVQDILIRPLSALHLKETQVEAKGLIKREQLLGLSGRGRTEQLLLAKKFPALHFIILQNHFELFY